MQVSFDPASLKSSSVGSMQMQMHQAIALLQSAITAFKARDSMTYDCQKN
jgi:hypothetical protein